MYDSRSNRKRKCHFDEGAKAETVFDAKDEIKMNKNQSLFSNFE